MSCWVDADNDTHGSYTLVVEDIDGDGSCTSDGEATSPDDCNDGTPDIYEGAPDGCGTLFADDGVDNNCNCFYADDPFPSAGDDGGDGGRRAENPRP